MNDVKTVLAQFLAAIGYPDRASEGALSFTLLVDGFEIVASVEGGALRLTSILSSDAALLPRLAGYAAGRMLREDAILAWGSEGVFLWQEASADASAVAFRRLFESFLDSCDWWRARVDALRGGEASVSGENEMMMIRP